MRDSQGRTGQGFIKRINANALLECVTTEDIRLCKETLMKTIRAGSDSDALKAIRILFECTLVKPKQVIDTTISSGEDGFSAEDKVRVQEVIEKFMKHKD